MRRLRNDLLLEFRSFEMAPILLLKPSFANLLVGESRQVSLY
ncbi:hypothetical protein SLEP1_g24951 [Rubroshorea leprosula]|uniref:Uncharacterized protein n=1 Tax=Rubroshorea leprosula TaxID=152421 RepID=A0AAV5JPJ6_9ROSI|nr:hypothetical protein SLEP1_g24951 [Rubroshorea leprosula]